MRKLFLIAFKDLTLVFRDYPALLFMLLAPYLLTLGLGLVTGSFSSRSSFETLDLPLAIVNDDGGALGKAMVDMLQSEELANLLAPQVLTDLNAARQMVDNDQLVAVVYVPKGFSDSIIPAAGQPMPDNTVQIELYTNPTRPTGVGIIKSIIDQFINQVEVSRVAGVVAVTQLIQSGAIDPSQASAAGQAIGESQGGAVASTSSIHLKNVTASGEEVEFNILALFAPGMALMFLMYTVSNGGRSLLVEKNAGTLPRLLVSPTTSAQILGGKVLGIFLTGVAQLLILILATSFMFRLNWGTPLPVLVLVLAVALGATGWGILMAAVLKTTGQISTIGSALMLIFGILGGSFTNPNAMPEALKMISRVSPNRWGLDGFLSLAMGGDIGSIVTPVIALLVMAAVLFLAAVIVFRYRGLGRT